MWHLFLLSDTRDNIYKMPHTRFISVQDKTPTSIMTRTSQQVRQGVLELNNTISTIYNDVLTGNITGCI